MRKVNSTRKPSLISTFCIQTYEEGEQYKETFIDFHILYTDIWSNEYTFKYEHCLYCDQNFKNHQIKKYTPAPGTKLVDQ